MAANQFKTLLKALGKTVAQVSEEIRIKEEILQSVHDGKRKVSKALIKLLSEKYNLEPHWFEPLPKPAPLSPLDRNITVRTMTLDRIAEDMFEAFPKEEPESSKKSFNYRLCVLVDGNQGPRDARYDFIRDMGSGYLSNIFTGHSIPSGDLLIMFPDRWLTPIHSQQFCHQLNCHPDILADKEAGRRRTIMIVTHQPYIVGECMKEMVRYIHIERKPPMEMTGA